VASYIGKMREALLERRRDDFTIAVKKAKDLEAKVHVLAPQHPTGLLLAHAVAEVEAIETAATTSRSRQTMAESMC